MFGYKKILNALWDFFFYYENFYLKYKYYKAVWKNEKYLNFHFTLYIFQWVSRNLLLQNNLQQV